MIDLSRLKYAVAISSVVGRVISLQAGSDFCEFGEILRHWSPSRKEILVEEKRPACKLLNFEYLVSLMKTGIYLVKSDQHWQPT